MASERTTAGTWLVTLREAIGAGLGTAAFIGAVSFGRVDFTWLLVLAFAPGIASVVVGAAGTRRRSPRLLAIARVLAQLAPSWTVAWRGVVDVLALADVARVESLLARHEGATHAHGVNFLVNANIWRGRYRAAVRAGLRARARKELDLDWALVLLNVAEALYNLGRWTRAAQLVEALARRDLPWSTAAWLKVGLDAQRAWIAQHLGDVARAEALMSSIVPDEMVIGYRAEVHFTRAAVALAARDAGRARLALDDARRVLVRESSRRNLLFLDARLAVLEGDDERAIALCREASEHAYRGQGGDGLLLWGDLLAKRGDMAGAQAAWRLVLERDPESEAASVARGRLT